MRQRTTNATEINKQSYGVNTCVGTTCSQTGIYTIFLPVDFNCVCCCQSPWFSLGNRLYLLRRDTALQGGIVVEWLERLNDGAESRRSSRLTAGKLSLSTQQ